MRKRTRENNAVSEIVGEMLMLVMVLVLLAVFSSSLINYLPSPRDPTVTIRMTYDGTTKNATLYHKGGDAIKTSDLTAIVEKGESLQRLTRGNGVYFTGYLGEQNPNLFDLGDWINVTDVNPGDKISLATPHAVIYNGRVS